MRNLAPNITRQKFLVEGFYRAGIDEKWIRDFFVEISDSLGLKIYKRPIVFSPGGEGRKENQGFDAFAPLIDSGISLYIWIQARFFSMIIYSCKHFDERVALETTQKLFMSQELEYISI